MSLQLAVQFMNAPRYCV